MNCIVDISPKGEIIVTGENASLFNEAFLSLGNEVDALEAYSISLTDEFQQTGLEPNLQNVVRYVESNNIQQASEFTPKEHQDIYNTNYKEFLNATSVNGEFALTYENLRGFFSAREADEIIKDKTLQNKIHSIWYKFKNQEETIEDYEFIQAPIKVLTDEKTSLGTYRVENTDKVYTELGAIATQTNSVNELSTALYRTDNTLFDNVGATQEILDVYQGKQALQQYVENPVTGQLEKKKYNSTEDRVLNTYDPLQPTIQIQKEIAFLLSIDDDVLSSNTSPATDILYRIEEGAVELGLDLVGLSDTTKSIEEVKDYLVSLSQFIYNPVENTRDFSQAHNSFFNIQEIEDRVSIEDVQGEYIMKVSSQQSEYDLYNQYGLIKIKGDVYKKVSKEVNDLFEEFYNRVLKDPSIVPQKVLYPYAFETETEFSQTKLQNQKYKSQIKLSLQKYIDSLTRELQTENSSVETLRELAVFKLIHKSEPRVIKKADYYNTMYSVNNNKFLDKFLPAFNKHIIKSKLKGQVVPVTWTQKGLELEYEGTYSAVQLLYSLPDSLRNDLIKYAQITNNIPSLLSVANIQYLNDIEADLDFNRNYYTNFKDQLPLYNNPYVTLDENTIQTRSLSNFIKIKNEIFEKVGDNIYTKVPQQNELVWDRPQQKQTKKPQSEQTTTQQTAVKVFTTNKTTQQIDRC